ncbi:MAG: alpha/beta hydrolase [Bacteroidia bacterium]|nr:alpha/beta hydrolase [Bacteroidia bacterium]
MVSTHFKILIVTIISVACISEIHGQNPSTAQPNVRVLDHSFEIPGLERSRQIRIYIPPGYNESDQSYPVLYMHDGQNLYDDTTSFVGEWGIDESLNELSSTSDLNLIVVGIDNGQEKRIHEMSPWDHEKYGKAEGKEYVDFIVHVIKPYIDSTYRTLSHRENTGIMGSSLGGFVSHFAIYAYPEVFGKAGILSSAYWFADEIYAFTRENPVPKDTRLCMVVGNHEGEMVEGSRVMYDLILETGHPKNNISFTIDPEGGHNETSWKRQFVDAVVWLFGE